MPVERTIIGEICREAPVVPAVVAAKGDHLLAGCGAYDPGGDRHRFASTSRKPRHLRPGVQLYKKLREFHLFRAVERGHRSIGDSTEYRCIHIWIARSEYAGTNAVLAHVDVFFPVQIPHLHALDAAKVRWPLLRQ